MRYIPPSPTNAHHMAAVALTAFIIVSAYKTSLFHDGANGPELPHMDYMWRLLIGLGCIPAVVALYFRLTIPETPRFTMDVERNVRQAALDIETILTTGSFYLDPDATIERVQAPKASRRDFVAYFSKRENISQLIGMAYSWFAVDVSFYGLGLNNSSILSTIGFSPDNSLHGAAYVYDSLRKICVGNMIITVAGLIPGTWLTFLFVDNWGRKPIQLLGFAMSTILFVIMGALYLPMSSLPVAADDT